MTMPGDIPLPDPGDTSWNDWAEEQEAASDIVRSSSIVIVGSTASPVSSAGTARPSGALVVYWMCANGITPTNAQNGDLIWNAP